MDFTNLFIAPTTLALLDSLRMEQKDQYGLPISRSRFITQLIKEANNRGQRNRDAQGTNTRPISKAVC